ncbi:hypothetical protein [Pseudorhodoplanes sinuspersici]|uniref:Uncharacterized protein n=1 Tax=Pseudorhodoplanes sinuspersici TaxID=1235591 RepID=A0A1W6ZQR0_9HYPH|nr:hypothetical protein [Pseudorhodoplanes sinuspersici]ARP99672.1 hypothetical protein CAK95_11680 [Pseudorhodoplanes sinuspersici]RKE70657.1 hypothetical protein DFP91_2898 [Pseudorhodoplanes sinuspersici]
MSRASLLEDLKSATADYASARQKLADAQFCQRHGMAHDIAAATMIEHTAYQRWLRAGTAFTRGR